MSIDNRTSVVQRMHGEYLVKKGETIHTAVITSLFIAPFLIFGKQLFEGDMGAVLTYWQVFYTYFDFLFALLVFMCCSAAFGTWIKNKGYDLIERANAET